MMTTVQMTGRAKRQSLMGAMIHAGRGPAKASKDAEAIGEDYAAVSNQLRKSSRTPSHLRVNARSFAAGARHVVYVGPWIQMRLSLNAALAAKFQHAIAQRPKECPIVRHEQHRPFVVFQRVDEHVLRKEIEVVRGLVEDEEVRRIEQHPRDDEPRLLAA